MKKIINLLLLLLALGLICSNAYAEFPIKATFTHTNPSIANASSVTLVPANAYRKMVIIQNNSAANICVNFNNATLTGIVPSTANPCIVIIAGGSYTNPPTAIPTAAITVYQTSGGAIETISVIEQS